MCDLGGGSSYQYVNLRKYRPDLKSKIITEDLPAMQDLITSRDELEKLDITLRPYDFMEAQLVHGTKVYYLCNVNHNRNDNAIKSSFRNSPKL